MNKTQLLLFGFAFLTLSCMATGDEIPDIDKNQAEMAQEESITEHEPVKAKKNIVKSKWQRVKKSRRFKILTFVGITLAGFVIWRCRKVDSYPHYKGSGKGAKKPVTPAARPPARSSAQKPPAATASGQAGQTSGRHAAAIRRIADMVEGFATEGAQDIARIGRTDADGLEQLRGYAADFRTLAATGDVGPLKRRVDRFKAPGDAARSAASDSESVRVASAAESMAPGRGEEDIFQGVVRGLRGVEGTAHTLASEVDADARAVGVQRNPQSFSDRCGAAIDDIIAGARAAAEVRADVARRKAAEAYNALPWYQRIFTARP